MDKRTKISAKNYLNLVEKIRENKEVSIRDFEIGPTLGNGTFGKVKQVYYRPIKSDFVFALKILKKQDLVKLNQVLPD
jgi:protein kinase A/protein kinase X